MIRKVLILLAFITPYLAFAETTLTIAVIDTGIDVTTSHLCVFGHRSFSSKSPDPLHDDLGHGTHVAGLINANAGDGNYCLISIKFYETAGSSHINGTNMYRSIQYAVDLRVDIINISGGGTQFSLKESMAIRRALDYGIKVVVAAGNESSDLDKNCNYFPACLDPRVVIVGNLKSPEERASTSNYGRRVTRWEIGTNVESTLPNGRRGKMSGTSQATAVATGKLVAEALKK